MPFDVVAPDSNRFAVMSFATSLAAGAVAVLLMATPSVAETDFPRDGQGRIIGWTETQGRSVAFELTADGKVAKATASGGLEASHGFDAAGRINAIQYPNGGRETLSYDAQGRLSAASDRLRRQHRFTHSASGQVLSHTDPAGRVIRFGRIPDRGIYGHKAGDASSVLYRYDASGRLVEANDGTHSVKRSFDSAGRMVRVDYPTLRKSVQYTYDDNGRRTSVTDPDGRRTRYEYAGGKLAAIEIHDGSRFEYTRDDRGRVTSLRYPNGVTGRWSYNDRGQVTAITYEAQDRSVVAGASYSYDSRGNLLARRDAGGAVNAFQYDEAGQLVGDVGPAGVASYRYGPGGNRIAVSFNGSVVAYKHDAADQILESGPVKYVHDVNGRLAERRTASDTQKFEFDTGGRLRRVAASDGTAISYEYLPTGQRISRSDGRRKSYFVYDQSAILQELNEDLKLVALYVHAPGLDRPLASIRPGQAHYYHADRNGSIIAMSDDQGRVVARYAYDGFGNPLTRTDGTDNPYLFNAREWEPELGLYYYRARYYDPAIGRFLTPDPLAGRITDPLDLNPYVFASNNPVRFKDPLGLSSEENDVDWLNEHHDVDMENFEYEMELLYEHDYLKWRMKTPDPRYSTPEAFNKLRSQLRALEAEMAEAGIAPPKPLRAKAKPVPIAEPSINDGTTIKPAPAAELPAKPSASSPGPRVSSVEPQPFGPMRPPSVYGPDGPSLDNSIDVELFAPDPIDVAAANAAAAAAEAAAAAQQPGTLRGPNAAAPGNTLRSPPAGPPQAAAADAGGRSATPRGPGAPAPGSTVTAPAEPSVSDSIDWQLRQPDSVDLAAAEAAAAARQPGTLRGPNAAPPGNTAKAPATGARPPAETLPAGPRGPSAAPPAGPGPRTAAVTPSGGAAPAAPGGNQPAAPEPAGGASDGAKCSASSSALRVLKATGTAVGVALNAMAAQEAGVEAAAEAARRGYKLDTVKGQLLADGLALRKAYYKVFVEPLVNGYNVTTAETNKAWDELEDAIKRGEDPGKIAGAWATVKGFLTGLDRTFNGPAIRDLCSEVSQGAPIDWIKEKVRKTPPDDPSIPNIQKAFNECHLREAMAFAELAKAMRPERRDLDALWPRLKAAADAEAEVETLLRQAVTTSDPALARKFYERATEVAAAAPCLAARVGKPAAAPPAPAACVPDTLLTDVYELCAPEKGTGRLVCYGESPFCKNGDVTKVWSGSEDQCRDKGGIWKAVSSKMLCSDISKPETCAPADCRPPGAHENAWTCKPVQTCNQPQKVVGLQSATATDSNVVILDSPDTPKPPDDPQVFVLDSPDPPPAGPKISALTPPPSSGINHGSRPAPVPTPRVNIYDPPMPELPSGPPRINIYEPPPPHPQSPAPGTPRINVYDPPPHSQPPTPAAPPKAGGVTPPPAAGTGTRNSGSCDTRNGVTTCVDIAGNKCTSHSGFCDPTPKTPGSQPASPAIPPKASTPPQPLPPVAVGPAPATPPDKSKTGNAPVQPLPPLPPAQLTPAGKAPDNKTPDTKTAAALPPQPLPPANVGPPGKIPDTKSAALPPQPLAPANVGPAGKAPDAAGNAPPGKVAALPPAILPPAAVGPAARPAEPLPPAAVGPAPQPLQPAPPPPGKTAELPPPALPNGNAGGDTSAPDLKCARTSQHIKAHDGANVNWDMDVPVNGHCRGTWRPGQGTHSLSIAMASQPGQGSATISGTSVIYQARPGYRGQDRFVLTIMWSNSTGNHRGTATYHVTVQ